MKRLFCICLALCFLVGCGSEESMERNTQPSEQSSEPTAASTAATEPTVDPEILYLRENLPKMDGSTSLIPLEAAVRAALFDISTDQATAQVSHSSTWRSFYNLMDRQTDLIFSCPLSSEQWKLAKDSNVELEAVPIAMEGFVFVVNAENPVDTLTQQQLRDIYSGRITNWSQVGGLDEPIIPYQRNADSGSQNFMLEFMGSTSLMDAPMELRPESMSGLMDVIAVNDNSHSAIGYSVYAYAANMYGNGDEIKFIQVDGVAPSKASFADRSYPLLGNNYAIFRADQPEDGAVRRLVDWLLTPQGQTAIAQAGYVTVLDVGFDYSESGLEKFRAIGTGSAAGEVPSVEYVLLDTMHYADGTPYATAQLVPQVLELPDGTRTYRITELADAALEAEINGWIDQQMEWVRDASPKMADMIEGWNRGSDYPMFQPGFFWNDAQPEGMDSGCMITAKNGFLSVAVTVGYTQHAFYSYDRSYRTETATWDLLSGKRLEPEDLFCEGVEIHSVLNEYIRDYAQSPIDHTGYITDMKQDFAALPTSGWHITHDTLYFDYGNPYFAQGDIISLENLPDGTLVCEAPRDFSQCLEGEACCQRQFRVSDRDHVYQYTSDGYAAYTLLKEDSHPMAAAINADVTAYLESHFTEDAVRSHFAQAGYGYDCALDTGMGIDFYLTKLGQEFLIFRGNAPMLYFENEFIRYPYDTHLIYDLRTGQRISWVEMLTEGWRDGASLYDGDIVVEGIDPATLEMDFMFYIMIERNAPLCVCFTDGHRLEVPIDFIRTGESS